MKKSPRPKRATPLHPHPAPHSQTFHFECTGDPKEIGKVEPFLNQVNDVARLDDGSFYRLLVAGTEAVNNGIIHGSKSDPRKKVHVVCILEKDTLVFRVKDQGRGFKPENVPDPLEEKNLLKTSGRGIFLMRSLMDKVLIKVSPKGTEVELVLDMKHHG
jgi:serine/threonine-protein kinase RsbW